MAFISATFLLYICFVYLQIIVGLSPQEVSLGNARICSPTGRTGKLKLYRHEPSITVVETRSLDKWSGHVRFHCRFEVKDAEDNAVFAVIQNLRFRKENGACIDYVEFRGDNGKSKRFCGEIDAFHLNDTDQNNDVAENSFIDEEGEMRVTIHVESQKVLQDDYLALKIAFTSAQKCKDVLTDAYLPCNDEYCIMKSLFNNNIVNCPYKDCKDEDGCSKNPAPPPSRRPSVGTKVTIGAITTVLMSFLLFFACIWVLRRYHKMCWANDFSRNQEVRLTPVPPVSVATEHIETHTESADPAQASTFLPSAPPVDELKTPIGADKDLPPSYESLFPVTRG